MKLPAAWRSGWWMWALPLTFCCVNALALFSHPGLRGEGFADMESRLTEEHVAVASLESKDRELAERLATALAGREGVQGLYEERFSTEAERLTELITHVKSLVNRAGLEAASISYPEEAIEEYGLISMSLVFAVEGDYGQLRTLVNLLELSDYFLILEKVSLGGRQESALAVGLTISTLFVEEKVLGTNSARGSVS